MLYLVRDHCYECYGEAIAIFEQREPADELQRAFPWLSVDEVDTEELLNPYRQYEGWFNDRADRALQERATNECCD